MSEVAEHGRAARSSCTAVPATAGGVEFEDTNEPAR